MEPSPETTMDAVWNSDEWNDLLLVTLSFRTTALSAQALFKFLSSNPHLSPADVERQLRKTVVSMPIYNENDTDDNSATSSSSSLSSLPNRSAKVRDFPIPLFLFAEDPTTSKFARNPPHIMQIGRDTPGRYVLGMSTKSSRSDACLDFEPGCRDIDENLCRLETAGFATTTAMPPPPPPQQHPQQQSEINGPMDLSVPTSKNNEEGEQDQNSRAATNIPLQKRPSASEHALHELVHFLYKHHKSRTLDHNTEDGDPSTETPLHVPEKSTFDIWSPTEFDTLISYAQANDEIRKMVQEISSSIEIQCMCDGRILSEQLD